MDIVASGFFALRTPLLSLDEVFAWSEIQERAELRRRLAALVLRPDVREAIFVASPSLDDSVAVWLAQPDSERGQKVERALVRYVARMAGRPTPFGMFAGMSVGSIGEATSLVLGARSSYRRHTRLDNDYLSLLCSNLSRDPGLRDALIWRPNSSIYRLAEQVRYVEAHGDGNERRHQLVAAERSAPLDETLERAANGARLHELARALVGDDATLEEARAFIDEIVDAQLLVPLLEPPITAEQPIRDIVAQLQSAAALHPPIAPVAARLDEARRAMEELDAAPPGVAPERYRAIAERLQELPADIELSRLFQVDLEKPAPGVTLGRQPLAEIVRAVALLHRLSAHPLTEDPLERFRAAFKARYEERRVPLNEVLDEELGIGFDRSTAPSADAAPLLAELQFGARGRDRGQPAGPHFGLLLDQMERAAASGAREVVLEPEALDALDDNDSTRLPLADSLAAVVTLAAQSEEALSRGDFLVYVIGVDGPSGANLLGRFCHGDAMLAAQVRAHLRHEEQQRPDALFAEIVHLPEARMGNLLLRPALREWDLVFLGRSGAPPDRQLLLDDLDVSVRGDRVVLHSRRLDREVIPRLTSAHNFARPRNPGAYRFLCALQNQGVAELGFGWGALERARFRPRLRVGKVVLSLARWRLGRADLAPLDDPSPAGRFVAAQALRRELGLPRWVGLTDADNVLPIDLENTLSIDTFAQLVRRRPVAFLTELFGFDGPCVRGPEGRFVHELVVPLHVTPPKERASRAVATPSFRSPTIRRSFPPGSEWLYAKIYTGPASADVVLREVIAPTVEEGRRSGAIRSWFFIRYADPDWHLRVRFCGEPQRLLGEMLPRLTAAIEGSSARGSTWRLQVDTYEREIERYGGDDGMLLSERLFCADSEAVLAIVEQLSGDAGRESAWRLALLGMDRMADDFGMALDEKHALFTSLREGFAREHDVQAPLARQIGDKFRRERPSLEALLAGTASSDGAVAAGVALLQSRSRVVAPIVAELRAKIAAGTISSSIQELARSHLHMHANRLLRSAARAQECVLYDFLARLYEGQRSRRHSS